MLAKRLYLPCLTALVLSGALIPAAQVQTQAPLWTHAFDIMARKLGEEKFTDKTQKYGVEVFKDTSNSVGIYCSQVGSIAATPSGFQALTREIPSSKGPSFTAGLDLPVRKPGQTEFKDATRHALEVFRDTNTENWLYITEKGFLAVAPAKGAKAPVGNKAPELSHSFDLQVRKAGLRDWKEAKKSGVEVYRDLSTGNLVYITEQGCMAVIAEDPTSKASNKNAEWLYGLDLKSRKATETKFDKDTKTFGMEVYRDGNNGNLIYITETGHVAVAPGPKTAPKLAKVENPTRAHAFNFRCRRVGETDFSKDTPTFGVEVFRDENVGVIIYLAETGSLATVKTQ